MSSELTVGVDGERAFVERLRALLPSPPAGQVWIGDDAAVLDDGVLLKTDVVVEGVHFDLAWCDPDDAGWKALAVNLSDIAAMGGEATAAVVSLVVRPDEPGVADTVMSGLAAAASTYRCPVVGGDTSSGPVLVVAVAVLGRCGRAGPVLRSGARPGDEIYVTGELGAAGAALAGVRAGHPDAPGLARLRRPTPRLAQGVAAAELGATAMIDLSDGLVGDLERLCEASRCAAVIDVEAIPAARGADVEQLLVSGDDYELVFTLPPDRRREVDRWDLGPLTRIGAMRGDGPGVVIRSAGRTRAVRGQAWQHPIPAPR